MAYNSSYTGAQIDAAVGAVRQKESIWDAKETPAGAQQKADAAKSAAIQASDPAGSASTVQQNLNSHTGNSAVHVTSSDKQNWNSKAPGSLTDTVVDLSSTLNGHTSNGNIHVTSADKEKWDGYSTVHTLSYYKSGVTHYLTGLSGVSGTVSCVFKATAAFNAGDTIRVDNTGYTIQLSNGEDPEDNLFVSGATVAVIVDKGNYRVNFKAGGGLSNSRLALANATAADVAEGKTFYAGNKTLKTGTLVPYKYATGTATWTHQSSGFTVTVEVGFRPSMIAFYSQKSLSSSVKSIVGWAYNSSTSNPNYFTGMIMMNVDIYSSHPTYAGYLGEYISVTDTSFTVKSITGSYVAAGDPVTYAVVGQ